MRLLNSGTLEPQFPVQHRCITQKVCQEYTWDVDDSAPQSITATLVGEAIATLAEMGVSPQVLGEFALRYPPKVVTALGARPQQDEPTDLEKVVFEQVTRALRADKGMRVTKPEQSGKRRVNVLVKGKRTTLSISASLVSEAGRITGSHSAGMQLIQQLAEVAPTGTPRSTWTEQELHQKLLFMVSGPAVGPQH
jgi:hypothetical protein